MIGEEPYRWLEAVANRREYIRDQLRSATPVFAFSRPEGILLVGVGTGQSKVFEIYDRHALAALGHPVDIEKVRQTLIEAAHLEGFTRAPGDVTLRRLLNFSLGPALKTTFEQIGAAPLMVECVFAELGSDPSHDVLARVSFDGGYRFETGVSVVHTRPDDESAAAAWLRDRIGPAAELGEIVRLALAAWRALGTQNDFVAPDDAAVRAPPELAGRVVEVALLDRGASADASYRAIAVEDLA